MVIIVWAIVYFLCKCNTNYRLDSYDMNKVSMGKMSQDLGTKSTAEIRRNVVSGKYDKDANFRI